MAAAVLAAVCGGWTLLAQSGSGGFVEATTSTQIRQPLSAAQSAAFLPARGRFTFPAPYGTQGVRITNATDCGGGDCVRGVGYSYWSNINNHAGNDTMLVFLGLNRLKGGAGPTLFSINKTTGETVNRGPLFPDASPFSWLTGEGWYFSATAPTTLYVNEGAKLYRYDVVTRALAMVFDAATAFGGNRYIWQMHSSNDDRTHSFTLRDSGSYAMLGCGVYLEATTQFRFFPAQHDYDECQVDKSGRFLLIKDNVDNAQGEDNVIVDLRNGTQQTLFDPQGAGGHSDEGFGYLVAEDNFNALPGAVRMWNFGLPMTDPAQGRLVFHATDWAFGSNHIAHGNSRADRLVSQQHVCSSSANRLALPHANEVLCYRLDGALQVVVVAPVMTNLDAPGGGDDPYWKLPKGNIDPTGEYFIWTSNAGGDRLDAFLVKVPLDKLGVAPATEPPPAPEPAPAPVPPPTPIPAPATATPVTWTNLVNTTVAGTTVGKSAGCNGCADAGAISQQQLAGGDGYVEFTIDDRAPMRLIGLSNGNPGTSANEIAFALRLQNGSLEVRERGTYRADTPMNAGDVARIEVSGGRVVYKRNGAAFYTSAVAPSYPLLVDTSFNDLGATIANAVISASSATTAPPAGPTTVAWTSAVNLTVTSTGGLTKTGGCNGCADGTAISGQAAGSADGYLEFAANTSGLYTLGLTSATTAASLTYGLRVDRKIVEVRENGAWVADMKISHGDALRISVVNGRVAYAKNGAVFYTSTRAATAPLRAGAIIYTLGASVAPATIK